MTAVRVLLKVADHELANVHTADIDDTALPIAQLAEGLRDRVARVEGAALFAALMRVKFPGGAWG